MTSQEKKLALLTELAKLPPHELAKLQVSIERRKAQEIAKTEISLKKKMAKQNLASHYGIPLGTPLNPSR